MKIFYTFIFSLVCAFTIVAQPTDNAAEPPARDASDVLGIYGDAYDLVTISNYDPNWGQSGHMLVNTEFDPGTGSLILAYPSFNYQGTEYEAQDASLMENLHIDIWVPAGTDRMVKVSPIDNSGDGPGEFLVEVPLTPGAWNSVDLAKSDFGGMSWNSVFQMKFDGQFNGDGSANTNPFDIYLDNIYFWKNPTAAGTDATLSSIEIDGMPLAGFGSGVTEYTVDLPAGTTMAPQITMVTTSDPAATANITQASGLPGQATVDVTAANGTDMETYIVSFNLVEEPTDSPNDPTQAAADVISVFSDAYTTVSGINYDPNWGQSGHTLVNPMFDPGTGNFALAYPNFNYQGTEFDAQDASEMEFLHIDIWVEGGTDRMVKVSPIDNSGVGAGEVLVEVPLTPGSWNSVDLPKSAFADMSWNSVFQMKFDGQFNSDGSANTDPYNVYLDNIYFWKGGGASGTDASLSDLQVDGATISGFSSTVLEYEYGVPEGSMDIPQVSATTTDASASASITQATAVPGEATVVVTSSDGTVMSTYTVSFVTVEGITAAPDPTDPESAVISLFSDVYTDVPVDTWNTEWSNATFEDVMIDGNPTKKYTALGFNGIETIGTPVDASEMMHLNLNIWSPNMTEIKIKIVDFLGDGFEGANGDTEAELTFPVTQGEWMTLKIPLSDFTDAGMTSFSDLNQYIISSVPFEQGELYVDNVYFSKMSSSANDLEAIELVKVFPNPVQLGGTLRFSESVDKIEVISLQGQLLRSAKGQSIDLIDIVTGSYLVRLTTQEGEIQISKIVVR